MQNQILTLAGIGCGGRTLTYFELAMMHFSHRFKIVAAADPNPIRLERARILSKNPDFRAFSCDEELFAEKRLADIVVIGTQDHYHVEPCIKALEKGYDVLLEKPIATDLKGVLAVGEAAKKYGRRVMVCHVLRYTPFYCKVKEILDSGVIGEVVAFDACEGVGTFHQAHSFVRGHWAVTEKATPMIIAKSCHDMDIISWLMGKNCRQVASFGSLSYFLPSQAPEGATPTCRGCPHTSNCQYSAYLYYTKYRDSWFKYVNDRAAEMDFEEFENWVSTSQWGRCVYHCDNTAVDRQSVLLDFEEGRVATFTMTAFDEGRSLVIRGTKGRLFGGNAVRSLGGYDIQVEEFATGGKMRYQLNPNNAGYGYHEGGDFGLVEALYDEMVFRKPGEMRTSIDESVKSHLMGFAAEESRIRQKVIDLEHFKKENLF